MALIGINPGRGNQDPRAGWEKILDAATKAATLVNSGVDTVEAIKNGKVNRNVAQANMQRQDENQFNETAAKFQPAPEGYQGVILKGNTPFGDQPVVPIEQVHDNAVLANAQAKEKQSQSEHEEDRKFNQWYKKQTLAQSLENKTNSQNQKQSSNDEKMLNDTMDTIAGLKRGSNAGVYGKARMRETLAADGLRLIDMANQGILSKSPQFEAELASQMAAMLTGGNQPAQQTIQEFITRSGKKDINSAIQYLTANPQDAISQSFLNQYQHQLEGQQTFWKGERQKTVHAIEKKLSGVLQNPEYKQRWEDFLNEQFPNEQKQFDQDVMDYAHQHNITPEQAQTIKLKRQGAK